MKEYRLVSWPELPAECRRMVHRRMLTALSQRFMNLSQLVECSGLRRDSVRSFMSMLDSRGVLTERDAPGTAVGFRPFKPLGGWLRRALAAGDGDHPTRS